MTAAPHPAGPASRGSAGPASRGSAGPASRGSAEAAVHIDLTGVVCPLTWVRARLALERLQPGQALAVRLDPGEPLESVPHAAREDGHVVEVQGSLVTIVKR